MQQEKNKAAKMQIERVQNGVKKQPITRGEYESGRAEVGEIKEAIRAAEGKVRSRDEAIRMAEKRIRDKREEIARAAESLNAHLITIGLQKAQGSTDLNSSKYHSGIHITMSSYGLFNDGKFLMDRDIKPIL